MRTGNYPGTSKTKPSAARMRAFQRSSRRRKSRRQKYERMLANIGRRTVRWSIWDMSESARAWHEHNDRVRIAKQRARDRGPLADQ